MLEQGKHTTTQTDYVLPVKSTGLIHQRHGHEKISSYKPHKRSFDWINVKCWWRGVVVNALVAINEVTLRRARLVLGWVTVCGRVNHLGM